VTRFLSPLIFFDRETKQFIVSIGIAWD